MSSIAVASLKGAIRGLSIGIAAGLYFSVLFTVPGCGGDFVVIKKEGFATILIAAIGIGGILGGVRERRRLKKLDEEFSRFFGEKEKGSPTPHPDD